MENKLSLPTLIKFNGENFLFKWSVNDSFHYKQEYLRKNDTLNNFNQMIFFDVLITDLKVKDIVDLKIHEIQERKGYDPVANYQVIENKQSGEYLIDFLISDGDLYEWNAYRYKIINTSKGAGVLLFSYCLRSFEGADLNLNNFFPYLKKNRLILINKVTNFQLPNIIIK